jgi:hypothetical protein
MTADPRSLLAAAATADRKVFGWLARRHHPVLDGTMPALSRAADHGLLWSPPVSGSPGSGPAPTIRATS